MKMRSHLLLIFALLTIGGGTFAAAQTPKLKLLSVKKIWDQGDHNAFTDLIRFNNRWFCIFREGKGHADGEGKLRVLTSREGETWESAALIDLPGRDLRDAKFSLAPGNKLMLVCGAADPSRNPQADFFSFVSFSNDGKQWSKLERIQGFNSRSWLWRVVWHKGWAYGVAYSWEPDILKSGRRNFAVIARSRDGIHYQRISKDLEGLNEAALMFDRNDNLIVVLRSVDSAPNATIAESRSPFTDWKTKPLIVNGWQNKLGGPAVLRLPNGRMVAGGRLYGDKITRTGVGLIDLASGQLANIVELPSGGDNSYPGLVWHEGKLWMSYYSSHEGKTSIYLAKIEVMK
ncbi:MAG: exo-alpha-sialidase [Acidobacteria bacterium]|nr:exo-alpha-sialidase [Acidobacteriota bacterium]